MGKNADWQLPPGVAPGTSEYFTSDEIANDYDAYFAHTSLMEFDRRVILEEFGQTESGQTIADFGCGTGRALEVLCQAGYRGLAIDMSEKMLAVVQEKARQQGLDIDCVRANLVQLDGLRDDCVDHGVCLFSTLGMIRGSANRAQAVQHFFRLIRPGGKLVVHVHNYWYNLYDPGGPRKLLINALKSMFLNGIEAGDCYYPYRGVYNMFLHVFRRREIAGLLRRSGFNIQRIIPLGPNRSEPLRAPWWLGSLRCNGWIIVAGV